MYDVDFMCKFTNEFTQQCSYLGAYITTVVGAISATYTNTIKYTQWCAYMCTYITTVICAIE